MSISTPSQLHGLLLRQNPKAFKPPTILAEHNKLAPVTSSDNED